MTYEIAWSSPAMLALRAMHWRDAERVDAAVQRYAATGQGSGFRYETDSPRSLRLEVQPYIVRLSVERRERLIRVWYIYRT
ncbi:hypothetical protein [Polyangium aurulentum]|uniref:hypothetical protein n=1 Tax=Polyangium aurulentum TaxID=2567896 RepID=UPI0010AEC621|nr:hypothetical protein [Polyangium aurulentum]UQA60054.1 hypothetical protein E8A73_006090 [Polyangium aurulentum]